MLVSINIISPDKSRDKLYLTNYAISQMNDRLARIPGVGDLEVLGPREYSMRIWLNPDKLSRYNMTPAQVVKSLREQNKQVAAGKLNQAPIANPDSAFELTINTKGRFSTPGEFGDIIIKYSPDGKIVKLKDVARVELGSYDYTTDSYLDGNPCVGISIYQLPGTNALDTAERIRKELEVMKASFPSGVDYEITIDNMTFIKTSINAVYHTIFEAVQLVVFVILLFLQSWHAAVIPLTAIPVSLIGTFGFMDMFGFSVNNISLFGIVLAIGIVVDNAIVIVENIERNMKLGMDVREATRQTMSHVQNALVAITLVLSAVFVPTAFVEGISGQFYKQFALTIATSTIISGVVSLTLSPALCVLLIKNANERPDFLTRAINFCFGWFFRAFNGAFEWTARKYGVFVKRILRYWVFILVLYVGLIVLTGYLFSITPKGFIPKQDNDYLQISAQLPEGYALERTDEVMKKMQKILVGTEGIREFMCVVGLNGATRTRRARHRKIHEDNRRTRPPNRPDYERVHDLPSFLPAAVSRHRPRAHAKAQRPDFVDFRDPAIQPRLDLRQRLQHSKPRLPRQGSGGYRQTKRTARHLQPQSSKRVRGERAARVGRENPPYNRARQSLALQPLPECRNHWQPRKGLQHGAGDGGNRQNRQRSSARRNGH